jgi:hypothetical protein
MPLFICFIIITPGSASNVERPDAIIYDAFVQVVQPRCISIYTGPALPLDGKLSLLSQLYSNYPLSWPS